MNPLIANYLKPPDAAPALGNGMSMPGPAPSMGIPIAPSVSLTAPAPPPPPTQLQRDVTEYDRQKNTGSGVSQIHNPLLRGVASAADIVGSVFAPNLAQFIPGTTLHHQLTMGQAAQNVQSDQNEQAAQSTQQQAAATLEGTKARTAETEAQTETANAGLAAGKLAAQKASMSGNILYDENKNPIGYQDPTGRMMGVHDASLPQNIKDILGSVKGKAPTSEFELWHQQNPNGTAEDFNKVQSKPLTKEQAASLNGVWDAMAGKHHLPTGQFTEGMPHADATQLASALNNAVSKQQGDSHVSISMEGLGLQKERIAATNGIDTSDPATQASITAVANGSMKLADVFGRGATTAQKAQFAAAVKQVNPNFNSGDHDIENSSRKYMISGQGGSTLTAGNTLTHHLDLYDKAVDAVHNGDVKILNQIGNELGIQMGSDAQTNLALIRQGVSMEAARYYTGGVPGDAEISQFNKSLTGDGSPRQMHGGASTVRAMAKGKLQGLQGQAEAGAKGQANFGNQGGGKVSVTAPDGSIHPFDTQAQADAFKKLAGIK
jgi:hypothetical protein